MSKRSKKKRDFKVAKKNVQVEEIKEILSVIKIIEVAKPLFKYTALVLFASFIYNWLSTGRFDGGMLFLVFVLLFFYRGFMVVQKDASLSLYNKFYDEHIIYSDFTGENSIYYPKYKEVVNYYENLRLDDIVKGGVEKVNSELNGNQARFKKAVPRNVLQNYRDYSIRTAYENDSLIDDLFVEIILWIFSSIVLSSFYVLLSQYRSIEFDSLFTKLSSFAWSSAVEYGGLVLVALVLVNIIAIYKFMKYRKFSMLKKKYIKASAVITEALGRFKPWN